MARPLWSLPRLLMLPVSCMAASVKVRLKNVNPDNFGFHLAEIKAYNPSGGTVTYQSANFSVGTCCHHLYPMGNCFDGSTTNFCHPVEGDVDDLLEGMELLVTYPDDSLISEMKFWNRRDCCEERAKGMTVKVEVGGTVAYQTALPNNGWRTAEINIPWQQIWTTLTTTTHTTFTATTTTSLSTSTSSSSKTSTSTTTTSTGTSTSMTSTTVTTWSSSTSSSRTSLSSSVTSATFTSTVTSTQTASTLPTSSSITLSTSTSSSSTVTSAGLSTMVTEMSTWSTSQSSSSSLSTVTLVTTMSSSSLTSTQSSSSMPSRSSVQTASQNTFWATSTSLQSTAVTGLRQSSLLPGTTTQVAPITSMTPFPETDADGSMQAASSTREVQTATTSHPRGSFNSLTTELVLTSAGGMQSGPPGDGHRVSPVSASDPAWSPTTRQSQADDSQSWSSQALGSSAEAEKTMTTSTAAATARNASLGQGGGEISRTVQELAEAVQRDAAELVESAWISKNQTRWERTLPTGPLVAQMILPHMTEGLVISVGGAEAAFSSSVLELLSKDSGRPVVVVKAVNNTVTDGLSQSAGETVTALVSVEVHIGPGEQMNVANLTEPVELRLPVSSSLQPSCVFWDEESKLWSTAGVTTDLSSEELRCLTTHFSVFAALLQGLVNPVICSQVLTLFTSEAIAQIWSGDWVRGSGALALMAVLLWLLASMLVAAIVDMAHTWGDEFFLNECRQRVVAEESDEDAASTPEQDIAPHGVLLRSLCVALGLWHSCCQWLKNSTVVRDVLDDIMSRWFQCFAEVRNLSEAACSALEFQGVGESHYWAHTNLRLTSHLLMITVRRTVAASLGVSDELVAFVMHDEELKRFYSSEHDRYLDRSQLLMLGGENRLEASLTTVERMLVSERDLEKQQERTLRLAQTRLASRESSGAASRVHVARFWSGGARKLKRLASRGVLSQGLHWKAARNKREAWLLLHHAVSDGMQSQGELFLQELGLARLVMRIFLVQTPLTAAFFFDPLLPSKMRCLLLTVDLCGTFMLSVLFFKADGSVKGKSGRLQGSCASEEDEEVLAFQAGRLLAVATSSVLFSILPGSFLSSLHHRTFHILDHEGCDTWQKQLQSWTVQDMLFLCLATSYSAFSIFTVVLFLSNVTEEDQEVFAQTVLMALAEIFLVIPLAISACVPVLSWLALNGNHVLGRYRRTDMMRLARERMHSNSNLMLPIMYI